MTKDTKKVQQIIEMVEDADGKVKFGTQIPAGVLARVALWTEAEVDEKAGDGVANGTILVSLSIAAYTKFACMSLMASTDIAAVLNVAYGTLATHTDIYHIDIFSALAQVMVTENTPIFVYHNNTAAAVTLLIIAPQTAKNSALNNDANHHFHAYMGGILI